MKGNKAFYIQLAISFVIVAFIFLLLFSFEEIKAYLIAEQDTIIFLAQAQLHIFLSSSFFAFLFAFFCGYMLSRPGLNSVSALCMQAFNICMAIPTLAMLALLMLIVGIGFWSAWISLFIVTLMPIARNTFTAFKNINPEYIEAAKGMGMSTLQLFWKVELPQSLSLIFAGIRTGMIFNIGTLPLIFFISSDSLGELIYIGLQTHDFNLVLIGSALTALMAIIIDIVIHTISYFSISKGIKQAN